MGGSKASNFTDDQLAERITYNLTLSQLLDALVNTTRADEVKNKKAITALLGHPRAKELLDLEQNQMALKLSQYFVQVLDEKEAYLQLASILRHIFEIYREDEKKKLTDRPKSLHSILLFQYYIDAFFRDLLTDSLKPRHDWQQNLLGNITGYKLSYFEFKKLDVKVRQALSHEYDVQDDNDISIPKAPLSANHLFDFSVEELERLKKAHAPKNVGSLTMVIAGGNDVNAATCSVTTSNDLAPVVVVDPKAKSNAMARISGVAAAIKKVVTRDS